jgi:hypothetical protein
MVRTDGSADQNRERRVKRTGLSDLKGVKNPPMEIAKVGGLAISIGKDLGELEILTGASRRTCGEGVGGDRFRRCPR